ncbi:MAG: hypothetical protein ACREPV_13840 [Lysobacter sp.]
MQNYTPPTPEYAPLVPTCRAHGIGRTKAFELARLGLLRTGKVGRTRVVYLDSLRTLPDRLAKIEASQQ